MSDINIHPLEGKCYFVVYYDLVASATATIYEVAYVDFKDGKLLRTKDDAPISDRMIKSISPIQPYSMAQTNFMDFIMSFNEDRRNGLMS